MSTNNIIADLSTKEKLLQTGMSVFAIYGYHGTTTRMLAASADVNLATIHFHFGNKETFYHSVLDYAAMQVSLFYDPLYNELQDFINSANSQNKDNVLDKICKLIELQMHASIDLPTPDIMKLLYWEPFSFPGSLGPISQVVYNKAELMLAKLMMIYIDNLDFESAMMLCRIINGGIISFAEHPAFVKPQKVYNSKEEWRAFAKQMISNFMLNGIKATNSYDHIN